MIDIVFHAAGWHVTAIQDSVDTVEQGKGKFELQYKIDELLGLFDVEPAIYLDAQLIAPDIDDKPGSLARWVAERFDLYKSITA